MAVQSALEPQPEGSILQTGLAAEKSQVYLSPLGAGLGPGAGPALQVLGPQLQSLEQSV
jgi:hypothetical protein